MRPEARSLDENEHSRPETFINMTWPVMQEQQKRQLDKARRHRRRRGAPARGAGHRRT